MSGSIQHRLTYKTSLKDGPQAAATASIARRLAVVFRGARRCASLIFFPHANRSPCVIMMLFLRTRTHQVHARRQDHVDPVLCQLRERSVRHHVPALVDVVLLHHTPQNRARARYDRHPRAAAADAVCDGDARGEGLFAHNVSCPARQSFKFFIASLLFPSWILIAAYIYIYIIYICFANILCSELAQCTQKASQALVSAVIVGPSRFCGAQLITCNESAVCVAELRPGNLIVAQCSAIPMTRCITLLFQTESPVAAPVRDGGCQHV